MKSDQKGEPVNCCTLFLFHFVKMQKHDIKQDGDNVEQKKDDVLEGITTVAPTSFKDQLKAMKNHRRAVLAGTVLLG